MPHPSTPWLSPWVFDLARFDEPDNKPDDKPADKAADKPADKPDDKPADKPADETPEQKIVRLETEAESLRSQAKTHEDKAKANADKAKRLDAIEAENQTETEKLTKRAEEAELRAAQRTKTAVRSEIRALADAFHDRSDAVDQLQLGEGGLERFVTDDGDIDAEAIKTALAAVLSKKAHLKKSTTSGRQDPSLGPRGDGGNADFLKADKAALAAEMAKHGIRPRS